MIGTGNNTYAQAPPILWQYCYGGDNTVYINSIGCTNDGGFIAAGITNSTNGELTGNGGIRGLWVLKLDAQGNILWEKTYSDMLGAGDNIAQTTDGGYVLNTSNHLIKLQVDGSIDWMVNMPVTKVHPTNDGGGICCCSYGYPGLYKLNANGSIAWYGSYWEVSGDVITSETYASLI